MSSFGKLNQADFLKGLVLVVIVALLGSIQQGLTSYGFAFGLYDWGEIIKVAITAGIGYLGKNLLSDESGKVLGKIG